LSKGLPRSVDADREVRILSGELGRDLSRSPTE
jgi:hypothetical protein